MLISGDIIRKQAEKLKKDLDFRRLGEDASAHQGETAWLGITPSMIEKCLHRGLKSAFVTETDDNQDEEEDEGENFEGFREEEAMEVEQVYRELMAQSEIAEVQEWMEVDAMCSTYE
ncbi:unnamed protein product [Caretta caretta]